ncbi:hypothetical protein EDB87DRAFT_941913 [Lactarius vividus]|nr:hypothetical protein EDB87DRAFT_941913 [Lactarius vividus]
MSTTATPSPSTSCTSLPHLLGKFSLPPRADIILRSSDFHDFLVQKLYVVDSSSVLGEQIMAAMCHGIGPEATSGATTVDSENKSELLLSVIHLAENHAIISSLLTFVFYVPPVLPPTIEQFESETALPDVTYPLSVVTLPCAFTLLHRNTVSLNRHLKQRKKPDDYPGFRVRT